MLGIRIAFSVDLGVACFKGKACCRYAVLAYLGYNQDLQRGVLLLLQQASRVAPGINT